jgi:hypothetical protein
MSPAKINVLTSSCIVSGSFLRFERNVDFLDRFSQKLPVQCLMEIVSMGVALIRADGLTLRR